MAKFIAEFKIVQNFHIYTFPTLEYSVQLFESRWKRTVKINASPYCKQMELWKGTEIYIFSINPWLRRIISTETLLYHVDQLEKKYGKKTPSNVIQFSDYTDDFD